MKNQVFIVRMRYGGWRVSGDVPRQIRKGTGSPKNTRCTRPVIHSRIGARIGARIGDFEAQPAHVVSEA